MIKLSKLADYGIVLLAYFVSEHRGPDGTLGVWTTRELAEASQLPLPTVSKVMKVLCKGALVHSQRGVHGGYRLARAPEKISVVDMIVAVEGPISMTECSLSRPSRCELDAACPVASHWQRINRTVVHALANLTLVDMRAPPALAAFAPAADVGAAIPKRLHLPPTTNLSEPALQISQTLSERTVQ